MASFTEPLLVRITQRDERNIQLAESFVYLVGLDEKKRIEVKEGFWTDGASVPRPFTAFISRLGKHGKAAILHDWLYRWPGWLGVWKEYVPLAKDARHAADMVFLEAMAVLQVPVYRRLIIYLAVRWFGWIPWRKLHAETNTE